MIVIVPVEKMLKVTHEVGTGRFEVIAIEAGRGQRGEDTVQVVHRVEKVRFQVIPRVKGIEGAQTAIVRRDGRG